MRESAGADIRSHSLELQLLLLLLLLPPRAGTEQTKWKNLCLEGKRCQALHGVWVVGGLFSFQWVSLAGVGAGERACPLRETAVLVALLK